jgi:hypothetical protein
MAGKCTAIEKSILQLLFCRHPENGRSTLLRKVGNTYYPARCENQNRFYFIKLHYSTSNTCHINEKISITFFPCCNHFRVTDPYTK